MLLAFGVYVLVCGITICVYLFVNVRYVYVKYVTLLLSIYRAISFSSRWV